LNKFVQAEAASRLNSILALVYGRSWPWIQLIDATH